MSAPVPPPPADDVCSLSTRVDGPKHGWKFDGDDPYIVCAFCDEMRDALSGRVVRVGRGMAVSPDVSPTPADDERVPPLTAQQLGLCGPLSDDPGVGPDAVRHTPPADDQAAPSLEAVERALKMQAGSLLARQVLHLRSMLAERTAAVGDAANRYVAERAKVAAVRALADDLDRDADKIEATGRADSLAIAGWTSYRKIAARIRAAVLDGPADLALSPAPKDSQTLVGPADAGLCPECGSEPDPTPLVTRPDMVECRHHCGAWVRPDADPAVTSALDWWHRRVREEEARRLASDTAAHGVLTEWSRMHPSGYLAMYPAMDALRAALAVLPVEAALIGTWADPEFREHQDHKHDVDGCGFCPSEEDR